MLAEAAEILATQGSAIQLRYLQTLTEIANETSNTIVFPLPMELVAPLLEAKESLNKKAADDRPG